MAQYEELSIDKGTDVTLQLELEDLNGNQKDLTNQIEIFNNDAAGFSFYNYSFMNYENLDWINKSLSLQDNNI